MKIAAFVMTFRRTEVLKDTISKLFSQTLPPEKILIVDNDPANSAENIPALFPGKQISYFAVGYNSGPAGAAYYGLKKLAEEGWEWIAWVDDDDPPAFNYQFQRIFEITEKVPDINDIGVIGAAGARLDQIRMKTVRLTDTDLAGILNVDMIAGNQYPIVNRRVVLAGILPLPEIFFGFEDLDFCLRVKEAGFGVLINGDLHRELRELKGRIKYRMPLYHKKPIQSLWREYYSIRTIVMISKNKRKFIFFLPIFFIRISIKSFYLFSYGFEYGIKNMKYSFKGFFDGLNKRMGMRVKPEVKTVPNLV